MTVPARKHKSIRGGLFIKSEAKTGVGAHIFKILDFVVPTDTNVQYGVSSLEKQQAGFLSFAIVIA